MSAPRDAWERMARRDPLYFIEVDRRKRGSLEEFLAGGERLVDEVLGWAEPELGEAIPPGEVLEIGCGLGRTTRALAARFERATGIDISPAMVEGARRLDPPANAAFEVCPASGVGRLGEERFTLVFSHLVLQHVPEEAHLVGCLAGVARILAPGGLALLQFDTRAETTPSRAVHALPDALLPRRHRRHMRRYRRDPEWLRGLAAASGLSVAAERGAGGAEHWLALRR